MSLNQRQVNSVGDQFLELFPTSADLQKRLPALPAFNCGDLITQWCENISKLGGKSGRKALRGIRKNPNQSLAVVFLVAMFLFCSLGMSSTKELHRESTNLRKTTIATLNEELDENDEAAVDHGPSVTLPLHFNYLSNSNITTVEASTPVLWSVPRSGGNTLAHILGECRGMVLAGAYRGLPSPTLGVVFENGVKQVNADLSTLEGRTVAREKGLREVHSDVVLLSSNLFEASQVFSGSFQAELWTWFRHPVERQISNYFYQKSLPMDNPAFDPRLQVMSLADWASSDLHKPNAFLTSLLGVPTSSMGWTELDLTVAKNVLRQKAHIGLLDQKTESVRRFLSHHGVSGERAGSRECEERLLDYAWTTKGNHPHIGAKSDAYQLLMQANAMDIVLYEYARYLFREQGIKGR